MLYKHEVEDKSDRKSRNWAGHGREDNCPLHYLFIVYERFFNVSWRSDELGIATVIYLCLQDYIYYCFCSVPQNPLWSETTIFSAVILTFFFCLIVGKSWNDSFEVSWLSRQDRAGFSQHLGLHAYCCMLLGQGQCFQVRVLTCSVVWRDATFGSLISFLAGPARTGYSSTW